MSTNDKKSLMEKYGRKTYPELVKGDTAAGSESISDSEEGDEKGYQALIEYREKKGGSRFRIIDRKGKIYGCGYAYLLGWEFTPPDMLSIYTTTHSFVLTGKHLGKIEDALLREKVQQLREYIPGKDEAPAPENPLIEKMDVNSRFA